MDIYKKLKFHLEESSIHIDRLTDVLNVLENLYLTIILLKKMKN
jgi:hypothetical protein